MIYISHTSSYIWYIENIHLWIISKNTYYYRCYIYMGYIVPVYLYSVYIWWIHRVNIFCIHTHNNTDDIDDANDIDDILYM